MKKSRGLEYLGFLSLFLTLITLAITITINFRPLYLFDIQHLNILENTALSQTELIKNYDLLLRFLNNPFEQVLHLPDFPMSTAGAGHFYDVKKLFLVNYGILLVTVFPSGWFVYQTVKQKRVWRFIQPFFWGMVLPVILAAVMAVGFDRFFITFHQLLFANDDWLFDPVTDPIINVLPEQFFMHCFLLFFLLLEIFFLGFFLWGKRELKKGRL